MDYIKIFNQLRMGCWMGGFVSWQLVGWAVVAPFMFIALYSLFLPLIWWSRQHFSAQDRPLNQRLVLVNEEVLLPTKDFGE
jgi:hypothetical protein